MDFSERAFFDSGTGRCPGETAIKRCAGAQHSCRRRFASVYLAGREAEVRNVVRSVILAALVLLATLVFVEPARAAETRTGDRVVIGADEVLRDDLYAGANTVVVDGTVEGDLVAGASRVTVNGEVEGDVMAAAQTVEISGEVGDDARLAGQALRLGEDGGIAGDLLAAGYSLDNRSGSTVGGDLLFGGYQALLDGEVGRDVRGAVGAMEIGGEVGRNVDLEVGGGDEEPAAGFAPGAAVDIPSVEPGLTLTDSARVDGDLAYESPTRADISPGAQVGGSVDFRQTPAGARAAEPSVAAAVALDGLRLFITLFLIGLVLVWAAPGWTGRLADTVRSRPLASLGSGLAALVAALVALVVVLLVVVLLAVVFGLISLGGLVPVVLGIGALAEAAVAVAFALSAVYLAPVLVSFLGGSMMLSRAGLEGLAGRILSLVVGLTLYVLLRAVPVVGTIVAVAVALLGLGALALCLWSELRSCRAGPETGAEAG